MPYALTETFEQAALSKHYNDHFRIESRPDGTFRTHVPGLSDGNGNIFGTTHFDSSSWADAKKRLMESFKNLESPSATNLLNLTIDDKQKVVFSPFDNYYPTSAPTDAPYPVPEDIQSLLSLNKDIYYGHFSFRANTEKKPDWEKDLYQFVADYAESSGLKSKLGIKDLTALTPRQSIDLTTHTVLNLTRFNKDNALEADKLSVLDLLKDGTENAHKPDWKGIGVCRHYASAIEFVFNALKLHQGQFSCLHNTYCAVDADSENNTGGSIYNPKRPHNKGDALDRDREGHAWNKFVTVTQSGAADITIADITWADRRSISRNKIENIDFTRTRMEPIVRRYARGLDSGDPHYAEKMNAVCGYYTQVISQPYAQGKQPPAHERERSLAYATNALGIFHGKESPDVIPHDFIKAVYKSFSKIMPDVSSHEVETLHKLSLKDPWADFDSLLDSYLDNKEIDEKLCFEDNALQKQIFEKLKCRPDFETGVKNDFRILSRMMDVYPVLHGKFSPATDPVHSQILTSKVFGSTKLKEMNVEHKLLSIYSPNDEIKVSEFMRIARTTLMQKNPDDKSIATLSDYALLSNYNALSVAADKGQAITPAGKPTRVPLKIIT